MEIRPLTANELRDLAEIDGTIESTRYLHLEKLGDGMDVSLKLESRVLREKQITSNPLGDDLSLVYRQIASGADEGIALIAEHEKQLVAAALTRPRLEQGTLQLLDLRVDSDFRREGIATTMVFKLIAAARDFQLCAVAAETRTNNDPANQLLLKLGFDISGIDARRHSNHDIVKESATLFWYAALD